MALRSLACAALLALASTVCAEDAPAADASPEAPKRTGWVYLIEPTRAEFATSGPTDAERAEIGKHFQYLKAATERGDVVVAGPVTDMQAPGIVIFEAAGEDAARAFFEGDPAVKAGVFKGSVHPMAISLLRERNPVQETPAASERILHHEVVVEAPLEAVWHAWSTNEGIMSFFGRGANIEARIGGPFEVYIIPDAPEGERGSDGCQVLSYVPYRMLTFSWNAPPSIPEVRNHEHKAHVVLRFDPLPGGKTRVTLDHLGWLEGPEWDRAYAYFDNAWPHVLESLKWSLEKKDEAVEE